MATRPSPALARSWLLVTGADPTRIDRALASSADQVVIDLEDGVDGAAKPRAREDVLDRLRRHAGTPVWVRINDRTSPFWADDVDGLRGLAALAGVVLPKAEEPAHISETAHRVGGPVVALVESALGIEQAVGIARARGVVRLAFGSGDYRRDTGTSADELAMSYPRSRLVVASRIGALPGPIDGPAVGATGDVLRTRSMVSASLGMTGKLCLATDQPGVINEVMGPSPAEVTWARTVIAEFEARGGAVRDGSDLPRLGRARHIDELASAFGLHPVAERRAAVR